MESTRVTTVSKVLVSMADTSFTVLSSIPVPRSVSKVLVSMAVIY